MGNLGSPPVGTMPRETVAPIPVPVPGQAPRSSVGAAPQVVTMEVKEHTCLPEDTSYEVLSQRFYQSKDYAKALQHFNRDYYHAADELRAGTQVQVPLRKEDLESRYPGDIPNLNPPQAPPARGSVSGSQSSPVTRSEPQPAPVAVTPPPAAQTPVPVPSVSAPAPGQTNLPPATAGATGGKVYRVTAPGEQLYEIARRTLGDGRQWTEIYRLNPGIVPGVIPGGTVLVMPDNARVGP
jgi:hypothetical protein